MLSNAADRANGWFMLQENEQEGGGKCLWSFRNKNHEIRLQNHFIASRGPHTLLALRSSLFICCEPTFQFEQQNKTFCLQNATSSCCIRGIKCLRNKYTIRIRQVRAQLCISYELPFVCPKTVTFGFLEHLCWSWSKYCLGNFLRYIHRSSGLRLYSGVKTEHFHLTLMRLTASWACIMRTFLEGVLSESSWVDPR